MSTLLERVADLAELSELIPPLMLAHMHVNVVMHVVSTVHMHVHAIYMQEADCLQIILPDTL